MLPDTQVQESRFLVHYELPYRHAVVYVLLPGKLNSQSLFTYKDGTAITTPVPVTNENYGIFLKNLYENENITHIYFCLTAPKIDYRINTQSGNFMWQGTDVQPIDSFIISEEVLYRLIIPHCIIPDIQRQLKEDGITEDYVYGRSKKQSELEKLQSNSKEKLIWIFIHKLRK